MNCIQVDILSQFLTQINPLIRTHIYGGLYQNCLAKAFFCVCQLTSSLLNVPLLVTVLCNSLTHNNVFLKDLTELTFKLKSGRSLFIE